MSKSKKILTLIMTTAIMLSNVGATNALTVSNIKKLYGDNRYSTASEIAGEYGNYDTVILVNADNNNFADGLSASGLAGVTKSPILLTHKDTIPNETQLRLDVAKKIYLIGNEGTISKNLETQLRNVGEFQVKRLGGINRFDTSVKIANEIKTFKPNINSVYIANGYTGQIDALSISPLAAKNGEPIILTNGKVLDKDSNKVISTIGKRYVIGGTNIVENTLMNKIKAERVSGNDRFSTNANVVKKFYPNQTGFYISDAYKLVDSLTGGPLAGKNSRPIVFVSQNSNKSIFKVAKNITSFGNVDQGILNSVAKATN